MVLKGVNLNEPTQPLAHENEEKKSEAPNAEEQG